MKTLETHKIDVRMENGGYPIYIGLDIDKEIAQTTRALLNGSRVAIVSDDVVGKKWGSEAMKTFGNAELFTFPHGEKNKTQENATKLSHALLEKKYGRDTLVVALGGGVVGDVAGYVAATYMRGVPYIQMPTTLLAMVDASVGGKVGVDTPFGKNTIGAFWQPKAVLMDMKFLRGLPKEQFASGLIEAAKVFYTADKDALALIDAIDMTDPLSTPEPVQEVIRRAVEFKAGVAERDEREENERRILNFGHTVGHAVETLSTYELPHGFAVGLGILVETKIAEDLGVLSSEDREHIAVHLSRLGVSAAELKKYDVARVIETMKADKKAKGGEIHIVLLKGVGSVSTEGGQFAHAVDEGVVKKAYEAVVHSA